MSQPCSAVEFVLFDARLLLQDHANVRAALTAIRQRGVPAGAIADLPDLARRLDAAGLSADLDFWTPGSPGSWPFERLLALVGVEPARALFISGDPHARDLAAAAGLQPCPPTSVDLERALP